MSEMRFFIDPIRCIGCKACMQACSECGTHRGKSMIHLEYIERGSSTQTAPMVCMHCDLPTCAAVCPADAIYVEGADNTDEERYSPGERFGRVYQINYLRCILCGYCIEACPTRALTMTNDFKFSERTREIMIYEKHELLAPLLPGMEEPPHPRRLGDDE